MKTKKTKMSLAEMAALHGVAKPVQAGCTFDTACVQQELSPTAGMSNRQRREYENAQKQRAHQEKRASELSEKFGIELEIRGGIDCDYYHYQLFAIDKDGVPFFACQTTLAAGEFIVPAECYEFSAYESAADFFSSAEVSSMPLKKAADLWLAAGSSQCSVGGCLYGGRPKKRKPRTP